MLTDPKLRSQVDALWDKFWTGGLSNPLDAIDVFANVVGRAVVEPGRDIESLRGRMSEAGRQACTERSRSVNGLFESLLQEAFCG
jgi:hypothetical protein